MLVMYVILTILSLEKYDAPSLLNEKNTKMPLPPVLRKAALMWMDFSNSQINIFCPQDQWTSLHNITMKKKTKENNDSLLKDFQCIA